MKLIRGLSCLPEARRGGAVTIGNFDGVHRGHQAILRQLRSAEGSSVIDTLVTFDPLPAEVLAPDHAPARLSSEAEKLRWLAHYGLGQCVLIAFSHDFSALSPEAFVRQILVDGLGASDVLVGRDFRYGKDRAGDLASLQQSGAEHGFAVRIIDDVTDDAGGERISSTRVRAALSDGDCGAARRLLGRNYAMTGVVLRGQALARTLGMPTANIAVQRVTALRYGVYAVRVTLADGGTFAGVANIGVRPSVTEDGCWLEVHLFDFDQPLYGQVIETEFVAFIRAEAKFGHIDALKAQMHRDATRARNVLT